jgi:hypothetical protein
MSCYLAMLFCLAFLPGTLRVLQCSVIMVWHKACTVFLCAFVISSTTFNQKLHQTSTPNSTLSLCSNFFYLVQLLTGSLIHKPYPFCDFCLLRHILFILLNEVHTPADYFLIGSGTALSSYIFILFRIMVYISSYIVSCM